MIRGGFVQARTSGCRRNGPGYTSFLGKDSEFYRERERRVSCWKGTMIDQEEKESGKKI